MTFFSPVPARRALQGGVAFAAFGALGIAAAVPAHAENGEIGYAHANVAGEADITAFHPRMADFHGTNRYLDAFGGEVFALSRTSVLSDVDRDQIRSLVSFDELRIELTEADVEAMRAAAEGGVSQPGLANPEGGSDEPLLRASFTGTQIEAVQNWAGDREFSHEPGTESVEVNELGAEISLSVDEAPWSDTLRDSDLGRVELWGGVQTLDMVVTFPDEGFSVSYGVGETIVASDTEPAAPEEPGDGGEGPGDGGEDPGSEGPDEEPGGEDPGSEAPGDGEDGSGGGDEGTEDGNGEDGDDGAAGDVDEADGRDPSEAGAANGSGGPLAQTGSPVAGLIAAGAAIAAGGGAAVYVTRRRRNASATVGEAGEA